MSEQNGSERIRVMVVDDHAVVRSGLATFLLSCDDMVLVGEAANGEQAVNVCGELLPDVVLMDLVMPEMDGVAATAAIRKANPEVQVIALTSFREEERVQSVIEAGAIGYLLKNASAEELVHAIRAAVNGEPTLAPEAVQALVHAASHPNHRHDYNLTPREQEVLALMTEGLNNREIAEQLVVSRSTVKFHVSSILAKLGTSSRTEAVALSYQHHLAS